MITLYTTAADPTGRELRHALEESGLAHDLVLVPDAGPDPEGLPEGIRPPALVDEGRVYRDRAAMLSHLDELKAMRDLWYKYGSDACFCDGEGNIE